MKLLERCGAWRRLGILAAVAAASGCGGGGGSSSSPAPVDVNLAPQVVATTAWNTNSPYASTLRSCTYAGDSTQTCTLATLPFLGTDKPDPTIDDIMERVLVSHDWMGANFRDALQAMPADLLPLFRSITAVVIASDIRPAFYTSETGAIYLDSDFLWLTAAERAVVSTEPDFRSNFGDALQVNLPWRYVRNNERLSVLINPDGSRDLDQILPVLAFLLYHELAHAVDFINPATLATLSPSLTPEAAARSGNFLSTQLLAQSPLNSSTLRLLAGVSFFGDTPTTAQLDTTPDDLVMEFANDGAIQYYGYSTQFEDFATLFETVMMSYHFGLEKDTGITDNPASGSNAGIVAWGQRGRLADQLVIGRAQRVLQLAYPGDLAAVEAFVNGLPPPVSMSPGTTWGNNLQLNVSPGSLRNPALPESLSKGQHDYLLERRTIR